MPPTPTRHDHLAWYAQIDVTLDPWPYTGVTTGCESRLMGVPVITLRGRGHAHNMAYSLLAAAGLDVAWSARDRDEYVAIAERAAADLPGLATLRAGSSAVTARTIQRSSVAASLHASICHRELRLVGQLQRVPIGPRREVGHALPLPERRP